MLSHLYVKNFALIDSLTVEFGQGFNAITGETGSGKSILLGALDLILGKRADISMVRHDSEKCVVEGSFEIAGLDLERFFEENELDYSATCIVRREVHINGRSRAFVNDTPCSVSTLNELASELINVHSQNDTISLNDPTFQLKMLDAFAECTSLRELYSSKFKTYHENRKALASLESRLASETLDRDFWTFQLNELEEAGLESLKGEDVESELKLLESAEEVKSVLYQAEGELSGHERNIVSDLRRMASALSKISGMDKNLDSFEQRLNQALLELEDLAREMERFNSNVAYDEDRIRMLRDKLDALNSLFHKHQKSSLVELLEVRNELQRKLDSVATSDEEIQVLKKQIVEEEVELNSLANELSEKRMKAKAGLEYSVTEVLSNLKLEDARFEVNLDLKKDLGVFGKNEVQYLFDANNTGKMASIAKTASGGERSRIMLALRSVLAKLTSLPTMVYDEIDAGVSGEVAHRVGETMLNASESSQLICITHLPQIAAKASTHFEVLKQNGETRIKSLNEEEQLEELAKMLSGSEATVEARSNAKVLKYGA